MVEEEDGRRRIPGRAESKLKRSGGREERTRRGRWREQEGAGGSLAVGGGVNEPPF